MSHPPKPIYTYKDLILAIPKIPADMLRELIAHMRLELQLRQEKGELND
jgi:hypothetical protein